MNKTFYTSPFTTHETKFLKDIGEYKNIMSGIKFMELLKKLPEDTSAFLDKVDKHLPNDPDELTNVLAKLEKQDPEFYEQLLIFLLVIKDAQQPEAKVEKLSKEDFETQEYLKAVDFINKKMKLVQ